VFTFVAVYLIPSIALHPASRRRSYLRFQPVFGLRLLRVSHPVGVYRSTAHGTGTEVPATFSERASLSNGHPIGFFHVPVNNKGMNIRFITMLSLTQSRSRLRTPHQEGGIPDLLLCNGESKLALVWLTGTFALPGTPCRSDERQKTWREQSLG
jgi:hypothetical protein